MSGDERNPTDRAWLEHPEPGWTSAELQHVLSRDSYVSSPSSPLSVHYYRSEDGGLWAKVVFGPRTQGPPGFAHGGSMAALLDEVMGAAAWTTGRLVVAASMRVDYRQMLRIPQRYLVEARVDRVEGRKVWTRAKLTDLARAKLYCESEGLFLDMGAGVYAKMGGEALRTPG